MYRKSQLDNGTTVVMEQVSNFRSVTLGVWVKTGSRNEPPEKNGISHFLEHMFFKGTKKRSASDIASEIDSVGGDLNAYTSKETTTFYVKVLDEHIEKGFELLTDVFLNSALPEEEIEKEKGIIKEEIKMVEDTPDDYVHDLFGGNIWGSSGLGQTVLGKRETVKSLTRGDLLGYIKKHYGASDTVVACAGNFNVERLLELLNETLGKSERDSEIKTPSPHVFKGGLNICSKDLSETHICLGLQGIAQASPDRYKLLLLNTILGGGLSSRLFQEIREKRGLAYSVYSFILSYLDTGAWSVYAGVSRKKAGEVIDMILAEFRRLADTVTEQELKRAKEQLKGNLILGLDATSRKMQNLANQEIYYGRHHSPSHIIKEIEAVTLVSAKELAEKLVKGKSVAVTVFGPVDEKFLKISEPLL